ncbi:hypothetical protein MTR67_023218 [Solanum verrucosum]|uniref:Uncharacterized protein n=1 Tax=Solanum verrucosum TaxID=315347 RepID=A0AAF0QUZ2_SOLVR|nr:hypothetical protein MTR67_023218 [Solanum verrucosum]
MKSLQLRGRPRSPSWVVDHLTGHTGTHGCQTESPRPGRRTTCPFKGRGPDDGLWWHLWMPFPAIVHDQCLRVDPRPDPRTIRQTMGRGPCTWIIPFDSLSLKPNDG